ncbi:MULTISPECIES: type II toxin-antitoxin system VapC family toxin [unclassified Caballeronia]|uniref:type II toxin-antitoxin system VapC family toxin n=1 Tax=unclassified Caballeronia TaxID=2646786 RepID=UPI00285F7D9E|nr:MULTISPECIES: type II toxin-antitoxin system VapC family toxin [unclassified Caballeronia]MDR5739966.1 type II toxin-antitoxin system VapC family toxin [Caballeronia sp. LZ016]MDR5807357.1 type II toxin-antitoxin system VapC family toxin [Caballeronia sp. LZ019]
MRLLLDTHIYICSVTRNRKLPVDMREEIAEAKQVYVSTASIWELSIKAARGKLEPNAARSIHEFEAHRFIELTVRLAHARAVRALPHLHRDPFDRLLVAQARTEQLKFLTVDGELAEYVNEPVPV